MLRAGESAVNACGDLVEVLELIENGHSAVIRHTNGLQRACPTVVLKPLIRAVVQSDGTVKEVNEIPRPEYSAWEAMSPVGQTQRHAEIKAYEAAERSLRTWTWPRRAESAEDYPALTPGTVVLGYERSGKFVIVKAERGEGV
jgi:hypothetical protein